MRWNPLLLLVALVLNAAPAFGNCEVGGYTIHTVAEYKPYEPHRIVLPYWMEGDGALELDPNALDRRGSFEDALRSPKLRLFRAGRLCSGASFSSFERYTAPHQYRLDAPHCAELLESLPRHGYAFLDATRETLDFADALPVGITELAAEDRSSLETEITARIPTLTLHAENGISGDLQRGRIEPGDIVSSRIETTTVGFAARPFVMAIAVLTLRNLDRLYPTIEGDADLGARLRGRTIEYPVIFFRTPAATPRYVGDGSNCATIPVASTSRLPSPPETLGAVERFRITGAFDTNADGAPDVLEVNDRFAYLLEPDGTLWVVNYGLGC